jgi:hypothetical protein
MELTLNVLWIAISIAMFLAFLRGSRPWRVVAVVAICLAAITFPIISITDDLCNDVLFADALAIRRTSHRAPLRVFAIAAEFHLPEIISIRVTCCGLIAAVSRIAPAGRPLSAVPVRGPPLRSC